MRATTRLAKRKDRGRIFEILAAAVAGMRDAGIDQWDENYPTPAMIEGDITEGRMLVCEDAVGVVGFVSADEDQPAEYSGVAWATGSPALVVHRLVIDPASRGQGHAHRLMDALESEARVRGLESVRLDAFANNPAACGLYEGRGYREAGDVTFRDRLFHCYEKSLQYGRET